ncbi:GNAT family N-acetyltransferase [Lentzea tibetensis]|uniref:GNAT family N-acetyltransferase n=1 Tax=Lentzea tibetensis TaxID=2591470 RepID=A0A563EL33_9PSEU|nr:GNAT family N-acetyltransferase [Lentzea tibetensis]TWP47906.1 GNAT family N-acetyltransferase [Lentzea tibetensis]
MGELVEAEVHADIGAFDELTRSRYAQDPVAHTTAITNLNRVRILQSDDPLILVTFHDGDEVVGSLFRHAPWPAQLSDLPADAVDTAVDVLRRIDPELPRVYGPKEISETFAARWSPEPQVVMSNRLYRLSELEPPDVPGTFRLADESDVPLLTRWRTDFMTEALPHEWVGPPQEEMVRRSIAMGSGNAIWERDGTPVAWAVTGRPIDGMTRIGPVYTPLEHRRHGCGAAVTAAVSRWAQHEGADHVVLFADLLNPVSNSIYQRIGFRAVSDWTEYSWKR